MNAADLLINYMDRNGSVWSQTKYSLSLALVSLEHTHTYKSHYPFLNGNKHKRQNLTFNIYVYCPPLYMMSGEDTQSAASSFGALASASFISAKRFVSAAGRGHPGAPAAPTGQLTQNVERDLCLFVVCGFMRLFYWNIWNTLYIIWVSLCSNCCVGP